jgi:hypothetical protein
MDICSTEWTWTTVQVLAIASASENDKLSTTENTENVRCFIVKMYTKKKIQYVLFRRCHVNFSYDQND